MEFTRVTSRTGMASRVCQLGRDETLRLPLGRRGLVAHVERGTLVVTQTGDPEDHVLVAGDEVKLAPHGLAVAWALTPAVLVLSDGRTVHAEACAVAA